MTRALLGLLAAALLMGCGDGATTAFAELPSLGRKAPDTVAVAGGAVVVGGPSGYCVDRGSSLLRGDTAFVLLASCASIARAEGALAPAAPGLLTASVDQASGAAPSAVDLLAFLDGPEGKAALARDGDAESVTILQSQIEQDAVLLRIDDQSANPTPGLETTYWRGLFSEKERLITVTVIGFASRPLDPDAGLAKLRGFIARIRAESSAVEPKAAEQAPARGLKGFFRKRRV
ncbi:Cation transport ATPase [Candidatus Rhodobacter oscarellae]|uniref:Cation transport ATPase n=1 Tax=Candidatus Rhodobacter oscarellae TaxID=1675527 RepID=A0A0J9E8X0_9RHOB|nr:hypothetical protein [Candidatus Rhodobacter lobularis]KMW59096.1 Cation transport ATPase [Candidatus Rhodobacter lobularis]